MANWLVTGGAGFIGSHIVEELVKQGENVRVIDDLSTGYLENIRPFLDKIEFIEGSITDMNLVKKAMEGTHYVLHQAAISSVPRSVEDPIGSNNANVTGTLNLLVAARDAKVRGFVYASSSSAYGNNNAEFKSEDLPTKPLSPYAIAKLTAEQYCKVFYELYGLRTVSLRYFNVFGPRQDPNSPYSAVIPLFIKAAQNKQPAIIFGDGTTSRDFTFVKNNVQANLLAARTNNIIAYGNVFNIAMGESTTLNDLNSQICKQLNCNISPKYKDFRLGDVKHSKADISKAKMILNYIPIVSFEEGLKETIEYYK